MSNALVSILVPCYNYGHFLGECLESVRGQSHANWECIIVDDGSTDHSKEVAAGFLSDPRFRYIYQANQGLSAARNTGLEHAKGDFIQLLDADDLLYARKLELQLAPLKDIGGRPALSICDYKYSEPGRKKFNRFLTENYFKEFILRVGIPPVCFLFSRDLFSEHGLRYDTRLKTHEDWEMMIRIWMLEPEVRICEEVLATYRLHAQSMTSSLDMQAGHEQAIEISLQHFEKESEFYRLLQIKKQLTRMRYADTTASGLLHRLLLRYAAWRYL